MLDALVLALALHAAPVVAGPIPAAPAAQTELTPEQRRQRAARMKLAERKKNALEGQTRAEGKKHKGKKGNAELRRRRAARQAAAAGKTKFEVVSGMRVVRMDRAGQGLKARLGPQLRKLQQDKVEATRKGGKEIGEKKQL